MSCTTWFQNRDGYEGCSFINVLLELGPDHPVGQASIAHIDNVRQIVRERAVAAGLLDVEDFAWSWHILMKGSIILAAVGDPDAALRAKAMAAASSSSTAPRTVARSGRRSVSSGGGGVALAGVLFLEFGDRA